MSLGKITRPLVPTAINQDLKALFLNEGVDKTYVEYLWRANEARIQGMGTGTTVKGIRLEDIRGLDVPLAPTAEQTRIANQLDALLTRIQSCNDRFDAIPALLTRFRQAVLDAAIRGSLSVEEGMSTTKFPYPRVRLSEVADARLGKMLDKKKNTGNPTPYIGNINVRWFAFDLENLQSINIEDREKESLAIRDGDVFICEGGEPGRCAIWNFGPTNIVFQKALHRVRPAKGRLLPQWLAYCMRHLTDTEQLKPLYTGTTIRHLTGASLAQVLIPLPEIDEQAKIVRRVEALFALADRLEARATEARTQAQRLTPLVLAKAFRGELVQQHPQDEPASVLLERIASQRTATTAKKPSKASRQIRAPRAPKEAAAVTKSRQDEDVKGKPYLADHLRRLGVPTTAEVLFKASELPIADFYKQLAWEIAQGHVADGGTILEARHAVG
jgi:type I restriction enzyme S subunit